MTREPLVVARALEKRFGDFVAVDRINVQVDKGEVFGFLGPNGAGKTSTMRMIACVSPRSGGELSVLGLDPATDGSKIRAQLGVVPQEDSLDLELTFGKTCSSTGATSTSPGKRREPARMSCSSSSSSTTAATTAWMHCRAA